MNRISFKQILPHLAAIALFFIATIAYLPPVLEGKELLGHDTQSWMCMAKETAEYDRTHDDVTLWTNSMFGGMPNYQIMMKQPDNLVKYIQMTVTSLPRTFYNLILYMIGFYVLLLTFRVNPWLAIVGALAFTFASYNFIIIAAGHNSKAITIAYMAPLIGSLFSTFRYNRIAGALLTTLFLSLAIHANHLQIIYYTLIIVLIFGIVELIFSIRDKKLNDFLKSAGVSLVAAAIAIGMNATALLTTYEYSKYTMRGDSNGLTSDVQNSQDGLNKDYITQWSYGIDETMTLLIPNFKGGSSGGTLSADSETAKTIKQNFQVPNIEKTMKEYQLPLYWGTQPFTSGPVYVGAIIIFLFVLSFWLVDKKIIWWLLPMILLTLMLSWGKNFMGLTEFFINHVPLYGKFRTVSMTLVATGFGITLMGILALKELLFGNFKFEKLKKPLYISAGITAGIALLFALIPSLAGNFSSEADQQFSGNMSFLQNTLKEDRASLLRHDALRSALFIILAAGLLWAFLKNILKRNVVIALIGILIVLDLAPIAKRYLNDDMFQRPKSMLNLMQPSAADQYIMNDKSQFRVLNATVNIFNDASPSYFHKNIGGYHAAKLRRYQELINMQEEKEIGILFGRFNSAKSMDDIIPVFDSLGVLNMLNLKYIIYNKDAAPLINPKANGNAWLVNTIVLAENANDEMTKLGEIDTKSSLVIDKSVAEGMPESIQKDSTAAISLTSYAPNHLTYHFQGNNEQVAVFSEIFYDKGWKATINGVEQPVYRANYLLRSMVLKAGEYDIDFKFNPSSFTTGNTIALISSLLFLLMTAGYFVQQLKKKKA